MTFRIGRRDFITLLGGTAAAWPLAARAQQPGKLRTIGLLGASAPDAVTRWVAAFLQRLHELGWVENRNIAIEYRWAEGRFERLAAFADEFVRQNVDIIVSEGTIATIAAKQATTTIPIVFPIAGDPLSTKLVASLSRPGGNVTGLSVQAVDLAPKRLELFREMVPGLVHLAIMGNTASPNVPPEISELQSNAPAQGIETAVFDIRQPEDIVPAFEALKASAQALYVPPDPLVFSNRTGINTLALAQRLPTMYAYREYIQAGGLVCYGPSVSANFRRAAEFVDKILHGIKPADIPVEQPTIFDLVINLRTAKVVGVTVPTTLLARANDVIE